MTDKKIYGSLGKVGVVTPSSGDVAIADFHRWLHPDILVSSTPVILGPLTPEGLMALSQQAETVMANFKAYNPVQLAFFSCTSGSFIGGPGYDARLCARLKAASGAGEAYTTTTAVLKGLCKLKAKKITIVTPYPPDINHVEKAYFEHEGFTVNNIDCIETSNPRDSLLISRITPDEIYRKAIEAIHPKADTLFLSCTGLTVFEIVRDLEKRLGIPVLSSNLAAAWAIGSFFGHHGPRAAELGSLFQ